MGWRGVSGVFFPAVTGKFLRQIGHDRITRHLGHDGCRRNRQATRIAFDNGLGADRQAARQLIFSALEAGINAYRLETPDPVLAE